MKFISISEYLMGRAKLEDLTPEQVGNCNIIVPRANEFLEAFGSYREITSGYRRAEDNAKVPHPKAKSKHLICAAVDLEDKDAKLYNFARANEALLDKIGLWCEERQGGWLHLQCLPPKSGKRFFIP